MRYTWPYPDVFVNAEDELKYPIFVMKFTSVLLRGVEFSVTLTITLTLSPTLFWEGIEYISTFNAIADTLNERSIKDRIRNLV